MSSIKETNMGTALVTGASSGIGAKYAERLARRGCDLILVARDRDRLDELAKRLGAETGRRISVSVADLTVKEDLARIESILREDKTISFLVNNAGVALSGDIAGGDPDLLENMIKLNAIAPTRLAIAAIAGFVSRGRGTLINISSVLALAPEQFNGVYSGTKAYLLNLSLRLQKEMEGTGVRVQAVLPGATRTAIWEKAGTAIESLPANILMDVDNMVDAALAGLDQGENVTIPSLPDLGEWEALEKMRVALFPNLSRDFPAERYGIAKARATN